VSNTTTMKMGLGAGVLLLGGVAIFLSLRLNQSQAKVEQLQTTTQQLAAETAREAMPELPVSVSFHKALLGGKSYVADFSTHGSGDMAVAVEWVDAATHSHRTFHVDVGPGRPTPLGHLQRFDFEPGDTLTMSHDGFKPVVVQVP
jgi:hypothetical protein